MSIEDMETEPQTALIEVERIDAPAIFGEGQTGQVLDYIRSQVGDLVADMSTAKGRAEIKSVAYKITRSKTLLDDAGKAYAADLKKRVAAIDGNRRTIRDELDKLRDQVRAPLTEWEAAEAEKAAKTDGLIRALIDAGQASPDRGAAELRKLLGLVKEQGLTEALFGDRLAEAGQQKDIAVTNLERAIAAAEKREAEAAELERLRKEAAEREALDAEQRRQAEADARAKAEAEKAAQDRIEAAEREAREAREAAERSERERVEAAEKAERERQALIEQQQAAEARRQREADEAAAKEKAEQERRLADREHRARINRAAAAALVEWGELAEDQAKTVVTLIASGKVPAVSIDY